MKFTQIYNETINLWPEEILISDGQNVGNEGGYFPVLSKVWNEAEENAQNLSNWHQLIVWAIFSNLQDQAKLAYRNHQNIILIENINLENVERTYAENLFSKDGGYSEMKSHYINDCNS